MGSSRSHRTPEHQADLLSPLVHVPDIYVFSSNRAYGTNRSTARNQYHR